MHLVAESEDLRRDIGRYAFPRRTVGTRTSKQVLAYLLENRVSTVLDQLAFYKKARKGDRSYQFWQEEVHPELIQGDGMMRQKIEYIHNNPVALGYVDEPEHWRYSSARNYAGRDGLLDVCRDW